jgi:L-threonylcarbamoyladenylate synthase
MQGDQKKTINIEENPDLALMFAVELFRSGKVFIYPTDTIYGLGGNPLDDLVVKRINEIKGRDEKKHFIWLLSDIEKVLNYAEIVNENHLEFLQKIWPAPVTVILNLNERTKKVAKQETAAIRIPQNDFCLKLLKEISRPLISTSVNRSGNDPINQIEKIINDFSQDVETIFFSSQAQGNVYSTIIDLTSEQPKLIREGSIKFVELLQNFT